MILRVKRCKKNETESNVNVRFYSIQAITSKMSSFTSSASSSTSIVEESIFENLRGMCDLFTPVQEQSVRKKEKNKKYSLKQIDQLVDQQQDRDLQKAIEASNVLRIQDEQIRRLYSVCTDALKILIGVLFGKYVSPTSGSMPPIYSVLGNGKCLLNCLYYILYYDSFLSIIPNFKKENLSSPELTQAIFGLHEELKEHISSRRFEEGDANMVSVTRSVEEVIAPNMSTLLGADVQYIGYEFVSPFLKTCEQNILILFISIERDGTQSMQLFENVFENKHANRENTRFSVLSLESHHFSARVFDQNEQAIDYLSDISGSLPPEQTEQLYSFLFR